MRMRNRVAAALLAAHPSSCCHLVMFRHVQKTGGTSVRNYFFRLAREPDGLRGAAGWRTALPFVGFCESSIAWRKTALAQWLSDRQGNIDDSPNLFIEYHVSYDAGEQFYADLAIARAAQSARCSVLAVAVLRRPEAWVRSQFKTDARRYRGKSGGPMVKEQQEFASAEFAVRMCDFVRRQRLVWGALANWDGANRVRRESDRAAQHVVSSLGLNVTHHSDDETTTHVNSQTNALLWRWQQFHGRAEAFALQTGANTSFDVIGTTEHLAAFVSEILRRTGHATRPPLDRRGASSSDELRLAPTNTSAGCPDLVAVLDHGAPDDVFDAIANNSVVDRKWWVNATHGAIEMEERLLPSKTYRASLTEQDSVSDERFAWVVHGPLATGHPEAPPLSSSLGPWDVIWLGRRPGDNRSNATNVNRSSCVRQENSVCRVPRYRGGPTCF